MSYSVRILIDAADSFKADDESERHSRMRSVRAIVPPRFAMIEILVLTLFLLVAIVAIVSCFGELSRLLDSDALRHVAAKAIEGGA
jgi:hypothetical protein